MSSPAAQEVAGPYSGFRRCLEHSRRGPGSIPVPQSLAGWVPASGAGLWTLLDFYRACRREGEGGSAAPCKRLLKTYADGYLDERADWDEICSNWCRSFLASDASACRRAVDRFSDPVYIMKEPLVAMCREFTGLEPSACRVAHPQRKAECLERTAVTGAIRSGETGGCPDESRASCQAALAPQADYCGRLFRNRIAFAFCRSR